MKNPNNVHVWVSSRDNGETIIAGYTGRNAQRLAEAESGGVAKRMSLRGFQLDYPWLKVNTGK